MAEVCINTNAAIGAKNIIAPVIASLTKEDDIIMHMHFLKGYHSTFFRIHLHWMKHVDTETKKNGYLSRHMAVHLFVMHTKLKKITDEWMTMPKYAPFIQFCSEQIIDLDQKDLTLTAMRKKFFAIAHAVVMKYFNQCAHSFYCHYH